MKNFLTTISLLTMTSVYMTADVIENTTAKLVWEQFGIVYETVKDDYDIDWKSWYMYIDGCQIVNGDLTNFQTDGERSYDVIKYLLNNNCK